MPYTRVKNNFPTLFPYVITLQAHAEQSPAVATEFFSGAVSLSGSTAYTPHSQTLHLHKSSSNTQATQAIPYEWKWKMMS